MDLIVLLKSGRQTANRLGKSEINVRGTIWENYIKGTRMSAFFISL